MYQGENDDPYLIVTSPFYGSGLQLTVTGGVYK